MEIVASPEDILAGQEASGSNWLYVLQEMRAFCL